MNKAGVTLRFSMNKAGVRLYPQDRLSKVGLIRPYAHVLYMHKAVVRLYPQELYAQSVGTKAVFPAAVSQSGSHTPSIAFRHLPPNSARFSYATEGALFISAQLSSEAVSALRKVRVLNMTAEAT